VVGVYVVGVYVEHGHLAVSVVWTSLHTWSTGYSCPGQLTAETDLVLVVEAQSTHWVHVVHSDGTHVGIHVVVGVYVVGVYVVGVYVVGVYVVGVYVVGVIV